MSFCVQLFLSQQPEKCGLPKVGWVSESLQSPQWLKASRSYRSCRQLNHLVCQSWQESFLSLRIPGDLSHPRDSTLCTNPVTSVSYLNHSPQPVVVYWKCSTNTMELMEPVPKMCTKALFRAHVFWISSAFLKEMILQYIWSEQLVTFFLLKLKIIKIAFLVKN